MLLKQTKIVATISDRKCDIEFIKELYDAGMNVVRLNTAHQTLEDSLKVIENVRKVAENLPILVDTKGPEIRTTRTESDIYLKQGDKIFFKSNPEQFSTSKCINTTYPKFVKEVPVGCKILIDDGELAFKVINKFDDKLECEILNDGELGSRKSINIPGVAVALPSLSSKDKEFINFAIEHNVTFIAHSFVRNKEDIIEIQKILDEHKSEVKIIAKIENQQGVDNIDEILEHAYGIMIARGDLGIEISAEKIPGIQKMIIKKSIACRKPVIVATQMLFTMIHNPRPTRAEVSDVATAIFEGTDAIMLSGETAYGKYPVEAVKTMTRIAQHVESSRKNFKEPSDKSLHNKVSGLLAKAAVQATEKLPVKCIVADSMAGRTIRNLAAFRGKFPILAFCYSKRLMRELALSYGVKTYFLNQRSTTDEFYQMVTGILLQEEKIDKEDLIVVVAGNFGPGNGASFIEISTIDSLARRSLPNKQ